jgi:hypothetical protein
VYMFEERLMPPEPDDQLERLLAAEEQAIRDNGFSQRVVERAGKDVVRRRTAIYGAGLAGLGFAVGGIVELEPYLTGVTSWIDNVRTSVESVDLGGVAQGTLSGTTLTVLAVAAGITCLVTAFSLQNR